MGTEFNKNLEELRTINNSLNNIKPIDTNEAESLTSEEIDNYFKIIDLIRLKVESIIVLDTL